MLDYKEENKKAYNLYARKFDKKFGDFFHKYLEQKADFFLSQLKGKKILDLGSGPGNHADYFRKKGFDVLCLDISEEMLKLCEKKSLKTLLMDIENLSLEKNSFDGIWAYTSLLHVPKEKLPSILNKLKLALKKEGILGISVMEGTDSNFETREHYPDTKRFFVYFQDEELRDLFKKDFSIISFSKTIVKDSPHIFLDYLLKLAE